MLNKYFTSFLLRCLVLCMTLAVTTGLAGCVEEDEYDNTSNGNFEALWHIMDEHYCFFDEKQMLHGVDWDEVHERYARRVDASMSRYQLFEVLSDMLAELHDGHVNLYAPFDLGRNWSWHEDYPANFSDTLYNIYIGRDYRIATSLRYRVLDDNVGYVRCSSFDVDFGAGNLDEIMMYLAPCNGLIIDVRNNGGGYITSAEELAARFTNEKILVGYMQHKTGRGHNDFSALKEQWLEPAKGIRWQKPVVVLTNRSVFSAANEFVKYMRCCPNATIVGDNTGGGGGMPFMSELPNGWGVRFSACPMYDKYKTSTEGGIAPDYNVVLTNEDFVKGRDTIIEFARQMLR